MPSLYTFTDYSPDWPEAFQEEADRLRVLLGDEFVAAHHIGSTSVPGLAAKSIIDVLPLVRHIERIDELVPQFEEAGYQSWGEFGLAGRRLFTKDRDAYRTHNIHTYQVGDAGVERHLAFCEYLRHHAVARMEYEALKRKIYAQHPADIVAYNNGKDAWIKETERVALVWYRQHVSGCAC